MDANEEFLYVVETTGGCISRLRVEENGELRNREVFGPRNLGKGAWPDGIAFDSVGQSLGNDGLLGQAIRRDAAKAISGFCSMRATRRRSMRSNGSSSRAMSPKRFSSPPGREWRPGWRA